MAKVLILADAGCHTGFGVVTHAIGERLIQDYGHDISVLASNYRGDYWPGSLKLYVPTMLWAQDLYGFSRIVEILDKTEPDVVLLINDPHVVLEWLVGNKYDTERVLLKYRPLMAYMPIDGYHNPPAWDAMAPVVHRVAMSEFGHAAMPGSELIYHGVDPVFRPMSKQTAKRMLGYDPERLLVLRVDKNSIRKNYADSWRALRPLLRKYPEIDVHFHCQANAPDGVNLKAFISGDEDIRDRVNFSPNLGGYTGWDVEQLRLLYSAADLFISTSYGEGFGLTLAEAMACETPIVASDCSAIPEVVGPGGLTVPPVRPWTAPMGQDQMLPDVDGFTDAIESLLMDPVRRRDLGEAGRAHVLATFSWDVAAARFSESINRLAAGVFPEANQTSGADSQPASVA